MIDFYNSQLDVESPDMDSTKIAWGGGLQNLRRRGIKLEFETESVQTSMYRPFCKQTAYFHHRLNERQYQLPKLFPTPKHKNIALFTTGVSVPKPFSLLITDVLPDLNILTANQVFALYYYVPFPEGELPLDADGEIVGDYVRRENITCSTLKSYQEFYEDSSITKEDIFYYVYAILHHPEYRDQYKADLAKMLPHIPKVEGFSDFACIGRELADLHLRYEEAEPYAVKEKFLGDLPANEAAQCEYFSVQKMRFGAKKDKSTIVFNQNITLSEIPEEAYEYEVNGRSAIEWIMESYQVKTHKASQITNDPNDYSLETGNPRYVLDLLKRIITVSLKTQKLVKSLPKLNIIQ